MKVLVTGASGYVGNKLCRTLLEKGYSVRALVRRTSNLSSLPSPDAAGGCDLEIAYGDITDYRSLLDAMDGCAVVFHAAALTEQWMPDPSMFVTVNVEGMRNVLEAAKETTTIKKIVCTISASALGPTGGCIGNEDKVHSEKAFTSEYEKSQVAALKLAMEAAKKGLPVVVVYLCIVYGPGLLTAGNLVAHLLVEYFNGGLYGRIRYGNNKFSFSHINDVVQGHIAAMERGKAGQTYLLTGENVSFSQVFDLATNITSNPKPAITIPLWLVEMLGWLLVLRSRFTGQLPIVSPPVAHLFMREWAYSCEKAKMQLGYNPRDLKDGILDVLIWLKDIGQIDY